MADPATTPATTQPPPADYDSLRDLVIARRDHLPKRLAQVAAYILGQPDEIAFGTVATIAAKAAVQPSTLIRFAQSMGYTGFSDLQDVFRTRLRDRLPDYGERIRTLGERGVSGSPDALFQGFADTAIDSIVHMQENLDPANLDAAVAILARAQTLYVLGQRRSFPVAAYAGYAFGKLGLRNVLLDAVGGMLSEQTFFTPDDALLAISFTPYSAGTADIAVRAHDGNVPVVAITDSAFSPLARVSRVWFEIAEADLGSFRSLSASFCLTMALVVATGQRRAENATVK